MLYKYEYQCRIFVFIHFTWYRFWTHTNQIFWESLFPFSHRRTVKQIRFATRRENIIDVSALQSVNLRQKHASLPCRGNSRYVFLWEINRSSWQYPHRQGLLYKDGSTTLTYSDDRRAARNHNSSQLPGSNSPSGTGISRNRVYRRKKSEKWQMCILHKNSYFVRYFFFQRAIRMTISITACLHDKSITFVGSLPSL